MELLGLVSEDEYYDRLRGAAPGVAESELRHLLNLVTVTETCFFRDAAQFRLFREHLLPALMSERSKHGGRSRTIRIWSAGCSSGEEAYSIAITLGEMGLLHGSSGWKFEIIGTDVNTTALERAGRAVYTGRAVRNVEGRLLDRYFVRDGRAFALIDGIKSRATFEFGNLARTPMPSTGPQDIVFCKNVSIYFGDAVARRLIDGLYDTITPGGYLLLGHAESLWQGSERFRLVEHGRAFCYGKVSSVGCGVAAVRGVAPTPNATARAAAARGDAKTSADPFRGYDSCLAAFRAGDWDAAERALTALVGACPTFVPGLLLLGGLYVHRGGFDAAAAQAERALSVSDLEPRAHLLLGMIAARCERHGEALQSLRRALYLNESLALAHFWMGNLYRDRGEIARACREYENVVRDFEHNTLQLTEEFAFDLTAEQLVAVCRETLRWLRPAAAGS